MKVSPFISREASARLFDTSAPTFKKYGKLCGLREVIIGTRNVKYLRSEIEPLLARIQAGERLADVAAAIAREKSQMAEVA
jgi:hypothetical protein